MRQKKHAESSVRHMLQPDERLTYLARHSTAWGEIENIEEENDDHENHKEARGGPSG